MTGSALRQPRPGLPTLPPAALTLKGGQLVSRAEGRPAEVDPALDRASALGAVLAQLTLEGLGQIGAQGPIHLTGPFAGNPGFVATLRAAWPAALHLHDYEKSIAAQVAELLAAPLDVTSRKVVWLFAEQLRLEFVPVLHRLQWRLAAEG